MPDGDNRERLFRRACLPENHWDCRLSEIPYHAKYKSFVVEYTSNITDHIHSGKGLYLFGDYGTGKTGIAAIICKAALNKGILPLWIAAEKIPEYMCEDVYFDSDILMKDRLFDVPLLIIDDLRLREQVNLKSDWIERWLESVIRRRRDELKATIITSNDNPAKLAKLKAVYAICCEAVEFVEIKGVQFRPDSPKKN